MSRINEHIGGRIRMYTKARELTLQQLADLIHKSRASVSKYENGEITLDVETLSEIADVLMVSPGQLMDFNPPVPKTAKQPLNHSAKSPFYQAKRLYFYFYDGRYKRLKDGIIDIYERENSPGNFEATLSISAVTPTGRSSEIYYTGKVVYSDMLIRFSFVNQCNALEEDLLCGISSADFMPCAFKCLVTLTPQEHTERFKQQLLITKKELQKWQKLNMLIVDNRGL